MSTPVKYADLIMLATERRDLGLDDGSFWPVLEGIPATEMFNVIPLAPGHAYGMFMERFNELSHLYATGGKVALKEIFHAQHSLGIAVTVVTQLLGDVAPQLQTRIKLTFHPDF